MDFFDAFNTYLNTNDYSDLYEVVYQRLEYNKACTLLQAILGSDFFESEYNSFIIKKLSEEI